MSIIRCEECGKEVSDKAITCPECGDQIATALLTAATEELEIDKCRHDQLSRDIRKVGLTLISYCFFCALTLGQYDEIIRTGNLKIPVLNIKVKTSTFIIIGPVILSFLSLYLHLFIYEWNKIKIPDDEKLPFAFNLKRPLAKYLTIFTFVATPSVTLFIFSIKARIWDVWWSGVWGVLATVIGALMVSSYLTRTSFLKKTLITVALLSLLHFNWSNSKKLIFEFPIDLRSSDFSKVTLKGLNLRNATLSFSNLEGATLKGVNLTGAKIIEANFEGANLKEANLTEAYLKGTIFTGANLAGANLERAILKGVKFEGANLEGTILRGVNLTGENLKGVNFTGVILESAHLIEANFEGANLTGAILSGTLLEGANFTGAILERTNFTGASIRGTILKGANLKEANFKEARFIGANLEGTNLEGANLTGAILKRTNLKASTITLAQIQSADEVFRSTILPESINKNLLTFVD